MDNLFILKILLSFIIAGSWIAGATFLAERLGSKIGGLITNLPSNILVSMIFVVLVNDITFAVNTVPSVPIGMAIDTAFLFVYIITLRYGLFLSTTISLVVWFGLAYLASLFNFDNLFFNTVFYFLFTIISFIVIEKFTSIPSAPKSSKKYTTFQMIIRAAFAGGIVSLVVLLSKFFNPYIVGILSTFPAVLLSSMTILVLNQSKEFAQATGKVLILSSSNIVIYVLVAYFTFPAYGVVIGTIISFIVAFIWVWIFHPIVKRLA